MEALLDGVEEGSVKWKTIVSNFYPDLDEAVKNAEKELAQVTIADEVSDEKCDLCGRQMVIKYGPHGRFLACPGFPECRNTKPYFEKTGVSCPKCGKDIVMKKTKKGRKYGPHGRFLACPGFPECRNTKPYFEKTGVSCPKCGKDIVMKKTKKGRKYYGCIDNPECDFMVWQKPTAEKCPKCGSILLEKGNKLVCMEEQCGYVTEKKENSSSK